MKKAKTVLETTVNNRVYKVFLKAYRESRGDIRCSRCPYHGGENHNNKTFKSRKGWKEGTKRKRQWKPLK